MPRLPRSFYAAGIGIPLLLFLVLLNPKVNAAPNTGSTITTSPVFVDLSTPPGTTISTNLQVENNAPSPIGITLKLKEFKASGDTGQAQIENPLPGDASISWVHFSQNSFIAQPSAPNSVTMTIKVPETAAFGYYYAVLFAPNVITNGVVANTNTVKGANAVLVLLDAHTANENNQLNVASFQADKTSYQFLPANFNVKVHNSGNIFTVPEGDIYISRTKNGPTIDTLDINPGQGNILPGTTRSFSASWADGFPVYQVKRVNGQVVSNKQGKPVEQLKWNFGNLTKFRFGKYYAHLVLVYNNGTREIPVNSEVSFWVIPWAMLVGLAVFIGLILLGLWTIMRNIIKHLKTVRKIK
jgi:hypothetical protein